MSDYYDRQGNPIGLMTWAHMMEAGDNHVADTWVDGTRISTVWLGLNHNFANIGPPLIFETMIFHETQDLDMEEYQWRWSTEVQALAGHDQALAMVQEALARRT